MKNILLSLSLLVALAASGCVTNQKMQAYVDSEVGGAHERVDEVEGQVEANQDRLDQQGRDLEQQGEKLGELSATAQDALDRAIAAGTLAEGKLVYERVMSNEDVRFGFDNAELSDQAKAALDVFATELKSTNANVFVEIQGHTDSTGPEGRNEELGLLRAAAIRVYINREHSVPLHRMSLISYGESAPVGDNQTREGRAQNRRVSLVVLQ